MPCYTTIATALATGKYDTTTLEAALKALGYDTNRSGTDLFFWRDQANAKGLACRGEYTPGTPLKLLARGATTGARFLGEIRAAYTRGAVAQAAKRHGMKIELDAKDPTVFRIHTDGRSR